MTYKRILTVQDISCLGQCSLTVALPILAACQVEACPLPTALLSSHTGGFHQPHIRDLTDELPLIARRWKAEGMNFDAISTGYLGSIRQIELVEGIIDELLAPGGKVVVDPAMADHGKLYKGFDDAFVTAMGSLCRRADVLIPNMTESCMLTGLPVTAEPEAAAAALHGMGIPNVIITGVSEDPQTTGILISGAGERHWYSHRRIGGSYHGTGDMFAAAFLGAWMQEKSLVEAGNVAADFTVQCIANTAANPAHWYGVKFETALPYLIRRLAQ